MNITEQFVFVHMPKTGGTFVAHVLRDIYTPEWLRSRFLRQLLFKVANSVIVKFTIEAPHIELKKHAPCREIPSRYAHLPIVSCMRNPLDWYVSNYRFQYWKREPEHYPGLKDNPRWPDLDFEYFLYLSNHDWIKKMNPGLNVNPRLGRLTTLFIQFYCKRPAWVLTQQTSDDTMFEIVIENMFPVHFLETSKLNDELYGFLIRHGYSDRQISFIKTLPPISPPGARNSEEHWETFYTPELIQEVLERDGILFRLFPEYTNTVIGKEK